MKFARFCSFGITEMAETPVNPAKKEVEETKKPEEEVKKPEESPEDEPEESSGDESEGPDEEDFTYSKTDVIPEGLQKTITTIREEMTKLESSPFWNPPKTKSQLDAEYDAALNAYYLEHDKVKKQTKELQEQILSLRATALAIEDSINRRAKMMQVEPIYNTQLYVQTQKKIQELEEKFRAIPKVEAEMPERKTVRVHSSEHGRLRRRHATLETKLRYAEFLAEQEMWRPAYIKYATHNRLKYDENDPDDIFKVCHKFHQEKL